MAGKERFNFACLTHAKFATLRVALQHKVGGGGIPHLISRIAQYKSWGITQLVFLDIQFQLVCKSENGLFFFIQNVLESKPSPHFL